MKTFILSLTIFFSVCVGAVYAEDASWRSPILQERELIEKTAPNQIDAYENMNVETFLTLRSPRYTAAIAQGENRTIEEQSQAFRDAFMTYMKDVKYSNISYELDTIKLTEVPSYIEADGEFTYGWFDSSYIDTRDGVSKKITQPSLLFEENGSWYFLRATDKSANLIKHIYPELSEMIVPPQEIIILKDL